MFDHLLEPACLKPIAPPRPFVTRKTLELMSQGGLDVKDLLADPNNVSTPVEAMRSIMIRGKEHGWTTSQLFGVFLEVGVLLLRLEVSVFICRVVREHECARASFGTSWSWWLGAHSTLFALHMV